MQTNINKFISISEFIEKAKKLGINFGRGNPTHRIRYYIKTGLLPHQIRLKEQTLASKSNTIGHLPIYALSLLQKIELLKSQKKSFEELRQIIYKQRVIFEAEEIGQSIQAKTSTQDILNKLLTFATITLLIVTVHNMSNKTNSLDLGYGQTQAFPISTRNIPTIPKMVLSDGNNLLPDTSYAQLVSGNIIFIARPAQTIQLQGQDEKKIAQFVQNVTLDSSGNIMTNTHIPKANSADQFTNLGTAVLKAHTSNIQIPCNIVTNQSKIFITPRSKTYGQSLIVTQVDPGNYFTVILENPVNSDIDFDWWVINKE